jgi:hypothetical protein
MEAINLIFCDPTDANKIIATIGYQSDTLYVPRVGEHVSARDYKQKRKLHAGVVFCVKHNFEEPEVNVFINQY